MKEKTPTERIIEYAKFRGMSISSFEKSIGKSNNYLKNSKDVTTATLLVLEQIYPDLSISWVITGKGEMLKTAMSKLNIPVKTSIPYYKSLPVSAGQLDTIIQEAEPDGYVDLPGVTAKALFPVVGCSMKPEINPGDVIGISPLESWEIVDPDKVYLVITSYDRMIKHLSVDETDDSILWCLSPNYPKFKIYKSDIKHIYRVTFCGKLI